MIQRFFGYKFKYYYSIPSSIQSISKQNKNNTSDINMDYNNAKSKYVKMMSKIMKLRKISKISEMIRKHQEHI